MATLDRIYTIPLRRETLKAKNYNRTPKAVRALKQFLQKHMKTESIKIGPVLNKALWENGIKNPPHKVRVNARKDKDGVVWAEMEGAPKFEKKAETPKAATGLKGKLAQAVKKDDKAAAAKPKDEAKPQEKSADAPKKDAAAKEAAPEKKKTESKPAAEKKEAPKADAKPAEKKSDAKPAKEAAPKK